MIELSGVNLAKKQKELNRKINDAANKKINFNEIKSLQEKTDIDKLYKIGVASKYKDVEYIMEILKSGDSLYITKALKSIWLYTNEYSNIINPEYLHINIFPFMSLKMIKIFLTIISINVRDEERAAEFYTYCSKVNLTEIGVKFAMFTSESFKLELLKDNNLINKLRESDRFTRLFLGSSFDLAEAYYKTTSEYDKANTLYQLRHFFFISNVKYLEMLSESNCEFNSFDQRIFGLRISKDILKRHKDEIYKNPTLYLHLLNKSMLIQYSTIDDAKFYAKTLITHECPKSDDFWNKKLLDKYNYIFDKIPLQERLLFLKNIFNNQYPEEEFETSVQFYNTGLYKWMTTEEREKWALRHIESGLELLGSGKDFMWYSFVTFDVAFNALKKCITVTVNNNTRNKILLVLVESAINESELEILFDYYYKRHVNEQQNSKECFVDAILSKHNVYGFSETCWDAFNRILYSLKVYDVDCNHFKSDYKYVAIIYNIIHRKELPDILIKFLDSGIYYYTLKSQTGKLPKEKEVTVYQYIMKLYLDKIRSYDNEPYNDEVKNGVRKYINYILDMADTYEKSKDDIPDIVIKYIKLDITNYPNCHFSEKIQEELTQQHMIYYLKKDKELVVSKLPLLKNCIIKNISCYKLNTFLKILRAYFSGELTSVFFKFFKDILDESNPYLGAFKTAVYGILEISDSDLKKEFISEYVPGEAKIDYSRMDRNKLYIQESICNMACHGRPPLPLSDIMKYIKGDYVHFCLPMFNSYMTVMPKPLCIEFVKSLLDTPLSVQKHGLRMAFKCFSLQDLRRIILDIWKNTKSVSLRSVIYVAVLNKIMDVDEKAQNELFEDLKSFTNSLTEVDDETIFTLLTSDRLPRRFIGEYLEVAWNVVSRLPEKNIFIEHRRKVIDDIENNMYLINKQVIESIIYDHVDLLLRRETVKLQNNDQDCKFYLTASKCGLFLKYISFFTDEDDFIKKTDLIMVVIKECLKMWTKVENNEYVFKRILKKFIDDLNNSTYKHAVRNYAKINIIYEQILKELQDTLPIEEIYQIIWNIRISLITRKVIIYGKERSEHNENHNGVVKESLNIYVKEFASLLVESIDKGRCYVSFFNHIQDALSLNLSLVLVSLNYGHDLDIGIKNTYVDICFEVSEYKSFETYMFALKLLPQDIKECKNTKGYVNMINKLKSCEYNEVKCCLYEKFIMADFVYRDFMVPQEDLNVKLI